MFHKCFLTLFATTLLFFAGCDETQVVGTVVNSEKAIVKDSSDKYHNVAVVTFKTDEGLTKVYCDPRANLRKSDCWEEGQRHILTLSSKQDTLGGYLKVQDVQEAEGKLIAEKNLIDLDSREKGKALSSATIIAPGGWAASRDELHKVSKDTRADLRALDRDMQVLEDLVRLLLKSDRQQQETLKVLKAALGKDEQDKTVAAKDDAKEPEATVQSVSTNAGDND